jgi:hypothetical protein
MLISVLIDRTMRRRLGVVAWVGLTALLAGGLVIAGAAFPSVWQGYTNDAAFYSLVALYLLTPLVASFTVTHSAESSLTWERRAMSFGLLAWLGLGVQNLLLPYIVPFARSYLDIVVLHAPANRGGLGYGFLPAIFVFFIICILYGCGLGLAGILGWVGGALRRRVSCAQRRFQNTPNEQDCRH